MRKLRPGIQDVPDTLPAGPSVGLLDETHIRTAEAKIECTAPSGEVAIARTTNVMGIIDAMKVGCQKLSTPPMMPRTSDSSDLSVWTS